MARGLDQALADSPVRGITVRAAADRAGEPGRLAALGKINVPIEVVPFEQAGDAMDRQASKTVRGKLVLQIAAEARPTGRPSLIEG